MNATARTEDPAPPQQVGELAPADEERGEHDAVRVQDPGDVRERRTGEAVSDIWDRDIHDAGVENAIELPSTATASTAPGEDMRRALVSEAWTEACVGTDIKSLPTAASRHSLRAPRHRARRRSRHLSLP